MQSMKICSPRRTRPLGGHAALVTLLLALVALPPATAPAQEELPGAFAGLLRNWQGDGTLFGRDATFSMTWSVALGGRFIQLDFANGFAADGTDEITPVITAVAYYRPDPNDAGAASGMWFDTRGVMLPLDAAVAADTLTTLWGDDDSTERGRTTYRIVGPDRMEVTDEVLRDGEYAVFARASLQRVAE